MLILLFRYVFAILAGAPAIPQSPGWTGPARLASYQYLGYQLLGYDMSTVCGQ